MSCPGHVAAPLAADDARCVGEATPVPGFAGGARLARRLAWASLLWMSLEGALGLLAGYGAGSSSLVGWAFGSAIEAAASAIVIWRFSSARENAEGAEARAQRAVAVSFFLLAPYVAALAALQLADGSPPAMTALGLGITAASLVAMPGLGLGKRRVGARLSSGATAEEGTQNLLCAAQAAGVLAALAVAAAWPAAWPIDPAIALVIAGWSIREGVEAWRGEECC